RLRLSTSGTTMTSVPEYLTVRVLSARPGLAWACTCFRWWICTCLHRCCSSTPTSGTRFGCHSRSDLHSIFDGRHLMKVFNDSRTGLLMGRIPGDCSGLAPADFVPTQESLSGLIVSHSGWRRVFAESGDEEDPTPEIGPSGSAIAACMAEAY